MNAPQTVTDTTAEAAMTQGSGAASRTPGSGDRYVVGIDGSAQSIDALRWAARLASATAAHIEVLTTWEPRASLAGPFIAMAESTYVGPHDEARLLLSGVVEKAYGTDHPPNVTQQVFQGDAADILVEESKTAQLLVVGSRGLGEVAGLLLGSVSAHCAEKAHCPVLIMRSPDPS